MIILIFFWFYFFVVQYDWHWFNFPPQFIADGNEIFTFLISHSLSSVVVASFHFVLCCALSSTGRFAYQVQIVVRKFYKSFLWHTKFNEVRMRVLRLISRFSELNGSKSICSWNWIRNQVSCRWFIVHSSTIFKGNFSYQSSNICINTVIKFTWNLSQDVNKKGRRRRYFYDLILVTSENQQEPSYQKCYKINKIFGVIQTFMHFKFDFKCKSKRIRFET